MRFKSVWGRGGRKGCGGCMWRSAACNGWAGRVRVIKEINFFVPCWKECLWLRKLVHEKGKAGSFKWFIKPRAETSAYLEWRSRRFWRLSWTVGGRVQSLFDEIWSNKFVRGGWRKYYSSQCLDKGGRVVVQHGLKDFSCVKMCVISKIGHRFVCHFKVRFENRAFGIYRHKRRWSYPYREDR